MKKLLGILLVISGFFAVFFKDEIEFKNWKRAAEQGDAKAQFNLGLMYFTGAGVVQDYKQAIKWYTKAAEQGNAQAQYLLAGLYLKGEGVTQDFKQAFTWANKSAEQGEANAQYFLGGMYFGGKGVDADLEKAHVWLVISAWNGNEMAAQQRDSITEGMNYEQITRGVQTAKEWMQKFDNKKNAQ